MNKLTTEVDFKTIDKMFIKQIAIHLAGTMVEMHSHKSAHATLLAKGRLLVWREGIPQEQFIAPAIIEIPAHARHQYQALEDQTLIYCLHNLHVLVGDGELELADLIDD